MKRVLFGVLIFLCWHSWSYAEIPIQFFLEGAFHLASIDGTVQQSKADILGTENDLNGTFGFEKVNGFVGKAGMLIARTHEIVVDYQRYHLAEDTTLATSIRFEGMTIPATLPISPSLTFQTLGFFYGLRVIDLESGFLSLRPGVELVDYEVGLDANLFGVQLASLSDSKNYVVPFILIAGEYKLHPLLSFAGEFSGGWRDNQTTYFARPMVKLNLYPHISALFGYSRVWFKDDSNNNLFKVALSGLMFGIRGEW